MHEIYEQYGLNKISALDSAIALFVIFLGCRIIAYVLLKRRMKKHFRELRQYERAAAEGKGAPSVVADEAAFGTEGSFSNAREEMKTYGV